MSMTFPRSTSAPLDSITARQDVSLADMQQMQEIFTQLANCMTEMQKLIDATKDSANVVAEHNTSSTSHEDLREKIDALGNLSADSFTEQLQQHDISTTSHAALRAQVSQISTQITNINTNVTEAVTNHNSSSASHSDIRAQISALKAQIGDLNVTNITEELRAQLEAAVAKLNTTIATVQNALTNIQQTVTEQGITISNVQSQVNTTNSKLTVVANNTMGSRNESEDNMLRTEELRLLHNWIDEITDAEAPYNFTHTLDNNISPGQEKTFSMHIEMRDEHETSDFTIIPIDDDQTCTFSKSSGIVNDEEITITASGEAEPGKIFAFRVEAKDTTNDKKIIRVVCILIAHPFQSGNIFVDNFPTDAEPGKTYTFDVVNMLDAGGTRYTYAFRSDSEHVTFNPAEASAETTFEVSIAREQERDVDVACTLTVTDTETNSTTDITADMHINPLPDRELFRHTVPSIINPDQSVLVRFYGVIAANGAPATYAIMEKPDWLTITPDSDIVANQSVTITASSSAPRGSSEIIKVKSHDVNDVEFEYEITLQVNQLPVSSEIAHTLPASSIGGKSLAFQLSGATDPDEGSSTLKYTIDPGTSGLFFDKTTNIKETDTVNVTLPKVADDTVKTFQIYCTDSQGERSVDTKTATITITPIFVADAPTITAPLDGNEVPYEGFTVTWSKFTYHPDIS